ncbi:hypothetical protein WJX74_003773 [Apatococcus lobatus]|uniref:arginyltransferase n=1 Tax=Apatococcus lobatus TaxID=904363 RepID=A0AAW1S197_9CHLO
MSAHSLTVDAYQGLIKRGWRRSGCWLYRPMQHQSCCKTQTIRMKASEFRPTKEQQRVRRRMERFLAGQLDLAPAPPASAPGSHPWQNMLDATSAQEASIRPAGSSHTGVTHARAGSDTAEQSKDVTIAEQTEKGSPSDAAAATLSGLLRQILDADVTAGRLPATTYPKVSVQPPSAKQRFNMPQEPTLLTSYPLAVANVAKKCRQRSKHKTPEQPENPVPAPAQLAQDWAETLQRRGWQVAAHEGYVLFHSPPSQAQPVSTCIPSPCASQGSEPMEVEVSCQPSFPLPNGALLLQSGSHSGHADARRDSQPLHAEAAGASHSNATLHHSSSYHTHGPQSFPSNSDPPKVSSTASAASAAAGKDPAAASEEAAPQHAEPAVLRGRDENGTPMHPAIAALLSRTAATSGAASSASARAGPSRRQRFMPGVQHRLKIVLRRSSPQLIDEEFPLYHRYQTQQHGDPPGKVSQQSFQRFLVDTPLQPVQPEDRPGACPASGLGSFHQQYWLDGELIAVGVVDILPGYLSSKYFFWDPDLGPLALGKFSALQEIELVRSASAQCPSLQYYTMGFYIHSCSKMRYKGDYQPSELLSFDGNSWLSYEDGVQAVGALSAPCTRGGSPVQGASASSSEVSGDSPRDADSPLSARSLEPEADEALNRKVASTLVWLPLSHLQCRVQRFSKLPELLPDAPRWRGKLQRKLETWHGLLGDTGAKLVLLLLAVGTS